METISRWEPIATAPKDRRILLSWFGDAPAFISWRPTHWAMETVRKGRWPFRYTAREYVLKHSGAWHVCIYDVWRRQWTIHSNCVPFVPTHWMSLPDGPPPSLADFPAMTERAA